MENWAETRVQLDQVLELERVLARQRRQQQWQRFLRHGKRLPARLGQAWLGSTHRFGKTLGARWQRILSIHS